MHPAFAIFAPLLGKCFAATLSPGTVDRHCFESMYEGQHVRDTHVVTKSGKAVYSGETIYTPDSIDVLQFTYVNSIGGVGHGKAQIRKNVLTFDGSMRAVTGATNSPMRGRWTLGSDRYDVVNEGQSPRHFVLSR